MDGDWLDRAPTLSAREEATHRLLELGAAALSQAELVAIITGVDEPRRVGELVREGLKALLTEPLDALVTHRRLEAPQAARLAASAELARRLHDARDERPRLQTPQAIYEWARARLVGARREEFHVLCLSSRNLLLRHVRVAEGSVDQCHVDPREALAPAIAARATGIVLVHNHPSGDPEPSVHDVALTRQLKDAARLVCIKLLDHLVLGESTYVSMLSRGLLGADEGASRRRLQSP
jgi:DNA repair protein RadC